MYLIILLKNKNLISSLNDLIEIECYTSWNKMIYSHIKFILDINFSRRIWIHHAMFTNGREDVILEGSKWRGIFKAHFFTSLSKLAVGNFRMILKA